MRSISRITRVVLCLAIAAVIAAVALTQSSHKLHAQESINRTWSYQVEAAPKQLGSASLNGIPIYNPYKIKIDTIEPHGNGQLDVEEKKDLFLLKKENKSVLEIPKESSYDIAIRRKGRTGGLITSDNAIELKSNHPDVLLCHKIKKLEEYQTECQTDVTTNTPGINVRPQNLEALAIEAGVLDQEVAATLLSFELDGKIDGQRFLVKGRFIYDNTEESRSAFYEKVRSRQRPSEILRVFGMPIAILIILVVPFIWLGMKKSQR